MTDETQEYKTLLFKIPDGRTLTGTATLEMPTLRDQFAMAILTGATQGQGMIHDPERFSRNVYLLADALMKVRKENQ